MREILFRGKSNWDDGKVKKGDWLYSMTISPHCSTDTEITSYYIGVGNKTIDGKTLGQYTGLTDKNGKKIFEGDIVEGHCHSQWNHRLQRCVVAYERDGFEARHYVDKERYYTYKVLFSKDVVVIGNIYDNPELLRGEGNI